MTCNKKLNGERVLNLILALMVALVGEFVWAQLVDSSCRQQCYTDEYHTSECLAKCEQVENIQALQTTSQPSLDTSALEQKKKQCEATVGAKKDLTPSKKELLIQACVAGSENSTQGGTEMNLNNCSGAVSAAKMACESSLFVQQGLSMLNQYQQFKAMGDFNNACNAARNAMTTGNTRQWRSGSYVSTRAAELCFSVPICQRNSGGCWRGGLKRKKAGQSPKM